MIPLKVPPLGESVVEATIARWVKKEGEAVAAGDTLVELETDKITVEVPAPKAGAISRRARQEGDVVKVDDVLGEFDETAAGATATAGAPAPAGMRTGEGAAPAPATTTAPQARPSAQATAQPPRPAPATQPAGEQRVSPAAQRLAAEQGADLSQVSGTGRGGVVSKPDVVEHLAAKAPAGVPAAAPAPAPAAPPSTPAEGTRPPSAGTRPRAEGPPSGAPSPDGAQRESREKMTTRRRRIAENLLLSQQSTATLTTFNEIDMSAVSALRERLKESIEKKHGQRLSVMPFFVRACTIALGEFPVVNASVDGESIVYHHYVNMGIAVASEQGLVVPNVKDADRKSLLQVNADIAAIAKRARDGKLTMEDLTGGTFTITNGGVFGSLLSTPIVNFPQSAILGMHKIQERPMAVDGKVEVRPMMYVALSYDHRIIDGSQSVQFLVRVKELMEDPASMLVS